MRNYKKINLTNIFLSFIAFISFMLIISPTIINKEVYAMNIFIRTPDSLTINIEVESSYQIEHVKTIIQDVYGIPVECQSDVNFCQQAA